MRPRWESNWIAKILCSALPELILHQETAKFAVWIRGKILRLETDNTTYIIIKDAELGMRIITDFIQNKTPRVYGPGEFF